ncbi:MAG: putative type II secretion system protein D precursor [Lentisphaerae bacterium ADurb.BinA184]|nr:MAG: putative type II secretion system protein D precursor [Lentisphaerae bacterium ADurb.BinA184]
MYLKKALSLLAALGVAMVAGRVLAQDAPAAPAPDAAAPAAGGDKDLVSLSVTEARIQDVLRSLAAMRQGVNILIDPDISGNVSFKLEDVPWETALGLVTEAHGLQVTRVSTNIYRVHRPLAEATGDLIVELHSAETIATLTDAEAVAMVRDPTLEPAAARERAAATPQAYLRRLTVDKKAPVDVVGALARKAGINYTFSPEVVPAATPKGKASAPADAEKPAPPRELPPISVNLKNLAVADAMRLVTDQGGLSATVQGGVWVVKIKDLEHVQLEPLQTATLTVNFLPLDENLAKLLQGLCTPRGKVSVGRNKILIVQDTAAGIEAVQQVLLVMDKPTPQVLIETRFFQIDDGSSKKLGVDWQDLGSATGMTFTAKPYPLHFDYWDSKRAYDPNADASITWKQYTVDPATGAISTFPEPGEDDTTSPVPVDEYVENVFDILGARTAILTPPDLAVTLHALATSDGTRQLANPKLVVSSDEQASIHIGAQTPIIKSTSTQNTGANNATVTYELDDAYGAETVEEVQLDPFAKAPPGSKRTYKTNKGYLDLGTKLTVLPSVKTADEVYIRVMPELITQIGEEVRGRGTADELRWPIIFRTYVKTQFSVRSGQTIAIGGLVSENKGQTTSSVPVLGDLPLLGRLFSYDQDTVKRSETVIFLTVKVLAGKDLLVTSAVPIHSQGVQGDIETIIEQDAAGAEYSQERVREMLMQLEMEEQTPAIQKLKRSLQRSLGIEPTPPEAE